MRISLILKEYSSAVNRASASRFLEMIGFFMSSRVHSIIRAHLLGLKPRKSPFPIPGHHVRISHVVLSRCEKIVNLCLAPQDGRLVAALGWGSADVMGNHLCQHTVGIKQE